MIKNNTNINGLKLFRRSLNCSDRFYNPPNTPTIRKRTEKILKNYENLLLSLLSIKSFRKNIKYLNLDNIYISLKSLNQLEGNFENLVKINFDNCQFDDFCNRMKNEEIIAFLNKCPKLEKANIGLINIINDDLKDLNPLEFLEEITFYDKDITNKDLDKKTYNLHFDMDKTTIKKIEEIFNEQLSKNSEFAEYKDCLYVIHAKFPQKKIEKLQKVLLDKFPKIKKVHIKNLMFARDPFGISASGACEMRNLFKVTYFFTLNKEKLEIEKCQIYEKEKIYPRIFFLNLLNGSNKTEFQNINHGGFQGFYQSPI